MKAVLAGTHSQFRVWCLETDSTPHDAFYVNNEWSLRGRIFNELLCVGTYYERGDFIRIIDTANTMLARRGATA